MKTFIWLASASLLVLAVAPASAADFSEANPEVTAPLPSRAPTTTLGFEAGPEFYAIDKSPSQPAGTLASVFGKFDVSHTFDGAWVVSGSFWLFLLSRIVSGGFSGNLSVATAAVADVTSRTERSKAMGLVGAAFGLGLVTGPTLGALTASFNLLDHHPSRRRHLHLAYLLVTSDGAQIAMVAPVDELPSGQALQVLVEQTILGQTHQSINALAVPEPGQQGPIGIEGIRQQQADGLRSCHLEHLLNERLRHRRFLALL